MDKPEDWSTIVGYAKNANTGIQKAGLDAGIAQGKPQVEAEYLFGPAKQTDIVQAYAQPKIRTFETGATRDQNQDKLDYEGFYSPIVLERFALYMHEHRKQNDGSMRASDNWQKGIPRREYVKSLWRHFMEVWRLTRFGLENTKQAQDAICGVLFNAMGLMHEILINRSVK